MCSCVHQYWVSAFYDIGSSWSSQIPESLGRFDDLRTEISVMEIEVWIASTRLEVDSIRHFVMWHIFETSWLNVMAHLEELLPLFACFLLVSLWTSLDQKPFLRYCTDWVEALISCVIVLAISRVHILQQKPCNFYKCPLLLLDNGHPSTSIFCNKINKDQIWRPSPIHQWRWKKRWWIKW